MYQLSTLYFRQDSCMHYIGLLVQALHFLFFGMRNYVKLMLENWAIIVGLIGLCAGEGRREII